MSANLRMFGEVVPQVSLLSEAAATHLAHKGLVACVHLLVNQQVIFPLEGFPAVDAHKWAAADATCWIPEPFQVT